MTPEADAAPTPQQYAGLKKTNRRLVGKLQAVRDELRQAQRALRDLEERLACTTEPPTAAGDNR